MRRISSPTILSTSAWKSSRDEFMRLHRTGPSGKPSGSTSGQEASTPTHALVLRRRRDGSSLSNTRDPNSSRRRTWPSFSMSGHRIRTRSASVRRRTLRILPMEWEGSGRRAKPISTRAISGSCRESDCLQGHRENCLEPAVVSGRLSSKHRRLRDLANCA